ncbi:ADP-ribosyltransferase [Desulfosporosinus sp. SRJS8]|nr:ADP-ribosyltransferase [Desulfosporosinus sp. SRJS8]
MRQWGKLNYSSWEQHLTQEEIKTIKLYTSCSFKFNEHLRHSRYPRHKSRIQHIDSALEKASTPEDIITFRWIDLEGFQELTNSLSIYNGEKFLEKGYSSTTLFFNGNIEYSGDVLFILKVPRHFNAACLKSISNIKTEDELLLKRNSTYTVEKIVHYTDTHVILLCNVR